MGEPAKLIMIGASAGGVETMRTIVKHLPAEIDAAVFVTLHIGAHDSDLPWLLKRAGALPACHPRDGDPIAVGHIYVAPPDHHLVVERGRIRLTKGPRENWARPAIDPMFRSAAEAYGDRVIGVILTGGLNDGTAGLFEVKAAGGTAIVQDPDEATSGTMPRSALAAVDVDHVLAASEIGGLLAKLAGIRQAAVTADYMVIPEVEDDTGRPASAPQEEAMDAQFTLKNPVAITCPDCGGALRQTQLGPISQFGCHIGHMYTMEVMLAAQFLAVERFVEQAMRSLSERAEICRMMVEKLPAHDPNRKRWEAAQEEALDRTAPLRTLLTHEWIHPASSGVVNVSSP